ncbi:MAG: O-antigen ligase domain-containing protein [Bacteroidetes bacterium]|nr:MAG: O-antigen ligase domain-containing protein [Bacteroidota bacterium]
MISNWIGYVRLHRVYLFLYATFAIGLPLNKIVLSLSGLLLFALFLIELQPSRDLKRIAGSKPTRILLLFLLVHLLSFFWSDNSAYFLKDFQVKLPFYALPLVFMQHPIQSKKERDFIFYCFLGAVTLCSVFNFIRFFGSELHLSEDVRHLSFFISHIRFGLMVLFSAVIATYLFISKRGMLKWIGLVLLSWFLIYTWYSEVLSAYLAVPVLICSALIFLFFRSFSRTKAWVLSSLTVLIPLIILGLTSYFLLKTPPLPTIGKSEQLTREGNPYTHNLKSRYFINDHHVYSFICNAELDREWKKVSQIPIRDTNQYGYLHYFTLVQYMASKGLTKDAEGFQQLDSNDIQQILSGVSNVRIAEGKSIHRLESLRNEFYDDDPNGKTLTQRWEYLKTGWRIFLKHPMLGVGSGDLADSFQQQYEHDQSRLSPNNQLRAHNQGLTYLISFGIIGGILFLLWLVFNFQVLNEQKNLLGMLFLILMSFSFLSEDTLETQMGVSLFSFFLALFSTQTWRHHEN